MKAKAIKKRIKEEGFFHSLAYYFFRALSKASMVILGKYTASCQVHPYRMVFKNRQMQDFSDNGRALFEYFIKNGYNEKYEIIYMVSVRKRFRRVSIPNVRFVTAESPLGFTSPFAWYYGATAKYFFYTNHSADLNRYHGKGQVTVNLWHGCGYKGATRNNKDIPQSSTMSAFDYALVPGPVFVDTKAAYWGCQKEKLLPLGYPRYDWMLDPSNKKKDILKRLLGWEEETKAVIWMPTFRKSALEGYGENNIRLPYQLPGIQSEEEMALLDAHVRKLGILLLVKKHPLQIGWQEKGWEYTNIRYISDELLQERDVLLYRLVGVCDGMLSDYSSIAVDYLLLDRPVGFVLTDYEKYENTRGFVFENPLEYMPGEKIYTFCQLKDFLTHVKEGRDLFAEERRRLLPRMHHPCECYCRSLAEYLIEEKENGESDRLHPGNL